MPGKIHGHETRDLKTAQELLLRLRTTTIPTACACNSRWTKNAKIFVSRFQFGKRYTGPPGHCHGGIIATILDDAMGKVNKLRHVVAVTKEMTVEYLKPVPLEQSLRVEGREVSVHGRQHINMAEILNEHDEVLARSRGTFIAIDPEKMFGKFVEAALAHRQQAICVVFPSLLLSFFVTHTSTFEGPTHANRSPVARNECSQRKNRTSPRSHQSKG